MSFSLHRGSHLDDALLRELWSFRISILRLKPETSPERDLTHFSARCRASDRVLVLRHGDGRVAGMVAVERRPMRLDGRRYLGLLPEYLVVSPELRGSTTLTLAFLRLLAALVRPEDFLARWFMIGVAYPASYLATARMVPLWIDGEPGIPAHAQRMIESFAHELARERRDPETRRVSMPTIPGPLREQLLATADYQRYLARNPDWQRGFGMLVYAENNPVATFGALAATLRRRVRRLSRRSRAR